MAFPNRVQFIQCYVLANARVLESWVCRVEPIPMLLIQDLLEYNMTISIFAFIFGLSQLILLWNLIYSSRRGEKIGKDPWGDGLGMVYNKSTTDTVF